MSTPPFPQCSLPIYHRLTRRINMFLDFTQCIFFLIKASYKKEPTKCWKLCTLIWERLIKFCMFVAFTSLQDIFPWWYSASDYLPTQTCICSRGQYTGDSAGSLQGGNEWSVLVPHWKMCSSYINMRMSAGDLIDMQIHRVITSCWAKEMPTLTSVCTSFCLIKGFFL